MKTIIALNNQSLFDIAIQEYGTIEAVFDLAMANNLGITYLLTAGQVLVIPSVSIITGKPVITNTEILGYYKKNDIKPATSMPIEAIVTQLKYGDKNYINNYFE